MWTFMPSLPLMISICTLVIYLCTLDGLESHWVQGGPIVTLATLIGPIHDP